MLYTEKVMDHFLNPRNLGKMEDADGVGEVGNARCGDIMRMYIKVDPDTQVITDVKFITFGCGSAIATSSMATEMVKGRPIREALELTNVAVMNALDGLPPQKIHCSLLAEEAVKAAVADYYQRQGIPCETGCGSGCSSGGCGGCCCGCPRQTTKLPRLQCFAGGGALLAFFFTVLGKGDFPNRNCFSGSERRKLLRL